MYAKVRFQKSKYFSTLPVILSKHSFCIINGTFSGVEACSAVYMSWGPNKSWVNAPFLELLRLPPCPSWLVVFPLYVADGQSAPRAPQALV